MRLRRWKPRRGLPGRWVISGSRCRRRFEPGRNKEVPVRHRPSQPMQLHRGRYPGGKQRNPVLNRRQLKDRAQPRHSPSQMRALQSWPSRISTIPSIQPISPTRPVWGQLSRQTSAIERRRSTSVTSRVPGLNDPLGDKFRLDAGPELQSHPKTSHLRRSGHHPRVDLGFELTHFPGQPKSLRPACPRWI